MYTGGRGPLFESIVKCTLGAQLSGTACATEKLLQFTLNRRLLQVAGAFTKDSPDGLDGIGLHCNRFQHNDW